MKILTLHCDYIKFKPLKKALKSMQELSANDMKEKEVREPLVVYPDALSKLFGRSMYRGAFISFLAPEKRGKSYFLMDWQLGYWLQWLQLRVRQLNKPTWLQH